MRVTLVSPPLGDRVEHPLGLLYLASSLEKNGFSVQVIDLNYVIKENQQISSDAILDMIKSTHPDVLGFTCFSVNIGFVLNLAKYCREKFNVPIILGGPHVSFVAKEVMSAFGWIDFVVKHEGEKTIAELLECIKKGKEYKNVKGIVFRKEKEIIETEERNLIEDLDELSFPAYHLVHSPLEYTSLRNRFNQKKEPETGANILSSRGCSFSCSYCNASLMCRRKPRFRYVNNVLEEVGLLKKMGVRFIIFNDDEFTINKKRAVELCDGLKEADVSWSCFSRVDTVDKKLLDSMKEAQCHQIFFGIESGSERILRQINKETTTQRAFEAIHTTINAGIKPFASFMCGFPNEDLEDLKKTVLFALKLKEMSVRSQCCFLAPFPGTALYNTHKNLLQRLPFLPRYLNLNEELQESFEHNMEEWVVRHPQVFSQYYYFKNALPLQKYIRTCRYINEILAGG